MKTAFVGSKIVTTGITNPIQLNRGEIALFSATGVLIDPTSNLTIDTPLTAYKGLGEGRIAVGATLYKGRLGKTSAASVVGINATSTFEAGTLDHTGVLSFRTTIKDPFMSTNLPREYFVELNRGKDEAVDAFINRFRSAVTLKVETIQKDIKDPVKYTFSSTYNAGDTLELAFVIAPEWRGSVTIGGLTFNNTTIVPPVFEQGTGVQVKAVEEDMAVHRGYNKDMKHSQGGFDMDYFTADVNKTYKLYCLSSTSQSPDSLTNEDGKGYNIEQLIFIDEATNANIVAADELIAAL